VPDEVFGPHAPGLSHQLQGNFSFCHALQLLQLQYVRSKRVRLGFVVI
jgi:hypothetical protein